MLATEGGWMMMRRVGVVLSTVVAFMAGLVSLYSHEGHAGKVMGIISGFDPNTSALEVAASDGEVVRTVLNRRTRILRGGSAGTTADLRVGSRVVVSFEGEGKEKTATEVQVAAPSPAVRPQQPRRVPRVTGDARPSEVPPGVGDGLLSRRSRPDVLEDPRENSDGEAWREDGPGDSNATHDEDPLEWRQDHADELSLRPGLPELEAYRRGYERGYGDALVERPYRPAHHGEGWSRRQCWDDDDDPE